MQLEETAEGALAHVGHRCYILQLQVVHIILGNVVLHIDDLPAVVAHIHLGKTAGGQGVHALAVGQFIEYLEKLHQG